LKDVYNAEKQLTKALPKMAKAASAPSLRTAFQDHLAQTKEHVARLEAVFKELGEKPGGKTCAAMEGLVKEGSEIIEEDPAPEVLDAGLIAAAQRVEHYEMAAYGTLKSFAKILGHTKAVKLLQATLQEEEKADQLLSEIAEGEVNPNAIGTQGADQSSSSAAGKPRRKAKVQA
jgi:ferritin-like metal-binding protein YciE